MSAQMKNEEHAVAREEHVTSMKKERKGEETYKKTKVAKGDGKRIEMIKEEAHTTTHMTTETLCTEEAQTILITRDTLRIRKAPEAHRTTATLSLAPDQVAIVVEVQTPRPKT